MCFFHFWWIIKSNLGNADCVSWPWRHHVNLELCVEHRKLNYQLILLAVVDAWSCCCLDTVLLLSAPDIEDTLNPHQGTRWTFIAWWVTEEASHCEDFEFTYERLKSYVSSKAWNLRWKGRKKNSKDSFLCLCRASPNRDINFLCVEFIVSFCTYVIYIYTYTLIALRGRQLARQLTLACSAKKQCCCQALMLS